MNKSYLNDKMKVLVIGNNEKTLEDIVDELEGLNLSVIGKTMENSSPEMLIKNVNEGLNKGYELLVIGLKDNIGAGILLNREKRIRAAPCSNQIDIELAIGNAANVILLNNKIELPKGIFRLFRKEYEENVKEKQDKNDGKNEKVVKTKEIIHKEQKERKFVEQEIEPKTKGSSGFLKNIKESLGIIDE